MLRYFLLGLWCTIVLFNAFSQFYFLGFSSVFYLELELNCISPLLCLSCLNPFVSLSFHISPLLWYNQEILGFNFTTLIQIIYIKKKKSKKLTITLLSMSFHHKKLIFTEACYFLYARETFYLTTNSIMHNCVHLVLIARLTNFLSNYKHQIWR